MKEIKVAIFNKESKALLSMIDGRKKDVKINEELFLTKEILIDVEAEELVGDYDNCTIVSYSDLKPVVTEIDSNIAAGEQIMEEYPIHTQLNILSEAVESIVKKLDLSGVDIDAFMDMRDTIEQIRTTNKQTKAKLETLPEYTYISKKTENEIKEKQVSGALSHILGNNSIKL